MPVVQRGWYPRGRKVVAKFNYKKRERFHAFGALGRGTIRYQFYEEMNSDAFIHFLRCLKCSYRRLLLFFDKAPWHTSDRVKRFLLRNGKSIRYELIPEKSPELSPIEIEWREWRKLIGNRYYEDKNEMREYLKKRIQSDDCNVIRLFDYLLP
jgi:transposase